MLLMDLECHRPPLIIDDVVIAQVENDAESFTTGLSLTDGKNNLEKGPSQRC